MIIPDIISIIAFVYFLCMATICVFVSRKCLDKAEKEDSFITFIAGVFVFFLALMSIGSAFVSLSIIP